MRAHTNTEKKHQISEFYKAKESRAIVIFIAMIALTFTETFVLGTTVGF
jgi:hypothetical protein